MKKILKFKKHHSEAKEPTKAHNTDAGFDLHCVDKRIAPGYVEYDTGVSIEIPKGYAGLLFPRSSVSDTDQCLANSVGVIDSGFTGTIKLRFKLDTWGFNKILLKRKDLNLYKIGDKVGQLVIIKMNEFSLKEVDELSKSDRGEDGFGSSSKE